MSDYTLHTGDCLAILPTLVDGSVDAAITDPPYGAVIHAGARSTRPGVGLTTVPLVNFACIGETEFLQVAAECVRVARRWVLMTCDWRHAALAEQAIPPARATCHHGGNSCPRSLTER